MIRGALGSRYGIQGALGRSVKRAAPAGGVVFYDEFTDTDNTLLVNHNSDINTTGNQWESISGSAQILSNIAKPVTSGVTVIDIGTPDCVIQVDDTGAYYASSVSSRHNGLILRYDGTDYLKVEYNRNLKKLRIIDTSGSVIAESSDIGYNVTRTLIATLNGSSITAEVIVSGNSMATIQANSSNNITATKHGIYLSTSQTGQDNFMITV